MTSAIGTVLCSGYNEIYDSMRVIASSLRNKVGPCRRKERSSVCFVYFLTLITRSQRGGGWATMSMNACGEAGRLNRDCLSVIT